MILVKVRGDKMAADSPKKLIPAVKNKVLRKSYSKHPMSMNSYVDNGPDVLLDLKRNVDAIDQLSQKLGFVMREVGSVLKKN